MAFWGLQNRCWEKGAGAWGPGMPASPLPLSSVRRCFRGGVSVFRICLWCWQSSWTRGGHGGNPGL